MIFFNKVCRVGPLSFLNVTPATFISIYSNCFDASGTSETVKGWTVSVSFVEVGGTAVMGSAISGAGVIDIGAAAEAPAVPIFTVVLCRGSKTERLFGGGKTVWRRRYFSICFCGWSNRAESQKCKNATDDQATNTARNKPVRKAAKGR